MSMIVEGELFRGKVAAIKPAYLLGGESQHPIAIISVQKDSQTSEWHLPLQESTVEVGDAIQVTPVTEFIGKGSITIYCLTKVSTPEQT